MHNRKLIILTLLLIGGTLFSQPKPNAKEIESRTYDLFVKARWDELINACNNSLDAGIDFYYLRMRLGTAYYEKKNYMSASVQFESALEKTPSDPTAMEYLYFSYLFSGRNEDARALAGDMPLSLRKKLKIQTVNFLAGAYTEGGYTYNRSFDESKRNVLEGNPVIYNEQSITKGTSYFNISLMHNPGSRITFFQAYNNINIATAKQIKSGNNEAVFFDLNTKQNEYYLNCNISAGGGFSLLGAIHYINLNIEDVNVTFDPSNNPIYNKTSANDNNFTAHLSIGKNTNHFRFYFNNSISYLNKAHQLQNGITVVYFPLGNLNLYTISDIVLHSNKNPNSDFISKGIYTQKAGLKLIKNLWFESFYTFGEIYNYNEAGSFVVYNINDVIKNRFGVNLISPISNKVELSLRYEYFIQETPRLIYSSYTDFSYKYYKNINHKLIGGIKWTF